MIIGQRPAAAREKVHELDALAVKLEEHRAQNRRVVHCHGVFDLLHIGHIRHFQQARQLGDILVVTITPDRFVNKGPHRPAFGEQLRAEAVAALDCVDFVAVNRWPRAVEAIQRLRPSLYVKGPDYRDSAKDRTGGIVAEEAAVREVGGQLAFTDDITFSSSKLINRHIPVMPKEVLDYLASFRSRFSLDDVVRLIERTRPLKVLAVGEAIIDEYQYCEAIGKSSKEPMLAVKRLETERFAGGILAVANHVANFADQVSLVTMLGAQHSEEDFIRSQLHPRINPGFVYRAGAPTIVKRRIIEHYFFTKLMEIYELNDEMLGDADRGTLNQRLEQGLSEFDVVLVMDFGHSLLGGDTIELLSEKSRFLALNVQANAGNLGYNTVAKYPRADYLCVAENELRLEARDRRGEVRPMVETVSRRLKCPRVVVTRGKRGCLTFEEKQGFSEVPAFAGQVLDRMGAGDSFISITSLCAALGTPMELLGFIGNAVGAQAVATIGHRSSVERVPLLKQIESLLK